MEECLGVGRGSLVNSQVSKTDNLCELNEERGGVAVFIVLLVFEIESSLRENRRKLGARMEWSQRQHCLPGTITT